MTIFAAGALGALTQKLDFVPSRVSSYDVTGGNADAWRIEGGETKVLAEIDGPGVISHIWFTISSADKWYLRKLILRIYWDDQAEPCVEAPLGDFFGLGHGRSFTYQCAPFSVSAHNPQTIGSGCALNCWWQMPFQKKARIEIQNEQQDPVYSFYFYIDYQKHQSLPDDTLYFHARWRRELPCDGWKGEGSVWGSQPWHERSQTDEAKNLSDVGNYLIMETEGAGHFVGVNFSIDHLYKGWWGEGDDMFFIDRDGERAWPPDLHGTGSEDYLCQAWGMQKVAQMYHGLSWAELDEGFNEWGKVCVYRYHIVDPVPFKKNIRVSIEHGHANDRSDDWASCAYWYQTLPSKPFCQFPKMSARIPTI